MTSIQKARLKNNFTQETLAEKLGIERSAIAKWETGRSRPRAEMLLRLAAVLDCTVDELLRNDPDTTPDTTREAQKGA